MIIRVNYITKHGEYKLNQQEELILKILSSVDVIKGKTKFVKILHLACKLLEENKMKSPFEFKADKYGVNAVGLDPVLYKLENENYVHINTTLFSGRQDLSAINRMYDGYSQSIMAISPKIEPLVKTLNDYSKDEILAISYHLFPDTTVNSKIKPIVNKKITELFSPLSVEFEEACDEKPTMKDIGSTVKDLYPRFNDMDVRMHMMKSIGLTEIPQIIPDIIDESTGFIAKKYPLLGKYNLEEMLENARRG